MRRITWVAAALLLLGCASYEIVEVVESEEQVTASSLFAQYMQSSTFLDPLGKFLVDYVRQHDKDLGHSGPRQHEFRGTKAFIEEPVKFAAGAEHPVAGVWHIQAYDHAGATVRTYNIWCFAAKGSAPELADGVMGSTLCDLELQFDVMPQVFLAAYLATGKQPRQGETPVIVDTVVTDIARLDREQGRGSWTEQWVLLLGAETITADIEFATSGGETQFNVKTRSR